MDQAGPSLEIFSKLNNNMSKPYVAQQLQQTAPNNNSSSVYQAEPFVVPVRIHSNIPSYGLASVAPIPQILVTQDQVSQPLCILNTKSVTVAKDQASMPKSHKNNLRCLPCSQPISLFENLVYEMEGKMPVSLGSLNLIQKVPVGGLSPQQEATASSKRMLSPANSLDIAMEKHQKRVKDESGAVSITGAVSLDPLNIKPNELNKQKKPLLVRQSCTTEPLESFPLDPDDKSGGANNSSEVLLSGSPESAQSKSYSFLKDSLEQDSLTASGTTNFAGRRPHQSVPQNTPSFLKLLGDSQERMSPEFSENKKPNIQAKSGTIFSAVNTGDTRRLSFPSLKTATNFTWCYLLKRKPVHLLQHDQHSSAYSSWSISPNNSNPLGLPTKIALSLLNSKQKDEKSSYTQAISTSFKSDTLVYSSKWENNLLKQALVKQKAAKKFSNKENSELSTDQDTENIAKNEPRRVKIFDGGYKSNEEYVYVRGRGRGKYICEECGIRCKKPSMLKKHIRTHTDVRPYHCNYCNFSFKTKGNLTKHMKSKAHSKKCMDLGVSVGLIDDQDLEDYDKAEKQRLNYEPSGFDPEDSDGPEDEDNDNEDDDEDSQAESVLSATPSVSASPQHHPSRNASHEVSSADEESRVLDCFAGVHTDSVDGLPKALLTKMTVLSTVQLDCRNSGPPAAAISREAKKESMQDRATSTEPAVSSETFHRSPCNQMYVDFPGTKEVLRSTTPSVSTTATLKTQEQKHGEHQQTMKLGPPQTHLFSHLPLHSQQQTKSPYGVVPVGGIHVVPAGLATYSTFLPIPAGPVQLTIPAVSVIHRTTSALGNPACAVSGTANHLGIAEVNSMVPIPIGQINVPGIQSLSAPALQPLPSLSMETVNILGLAGTGLAPQLHHSGLTLNAVGLQVLTANPSSQRTSSPQAHIPGLQILNIALPTLAPPVSPKAVDNQGIVEPPASRNNTCETFQDQGSGSLATPDPAQIGSAPSSQKAPADKRYSIENRLEVGPARDYRRRDIPDNPDSESSDSESPKKPKCNISAVQVGQPSGSELPAKVNSDILSSSPGHQMVPQDKEFHRPKRLPKVDLSDGSSDDEDRLVIAT
ncbi:hypothetical protein E2320_011125 [Naja naja]|nr:hypothetical protein E2320_011125 [Naja naja]